MSENPLWQPSSARIHGTRLYAFQRKVEAVTGRTFAGYYEFWQWSIDHMETFWDIFWDEAGVIGEKGDTVLQWDGPMIDARYFPNGTINYAENLLRHMGGGTAMIFRDEHGAERSLSFNALRAQVSQLQQALKDMGVKKGDRVAGYLPNLPETIIAHLAAASLGAIWSSASPDFGVQGLLDRFGQIEPKVLIAADGYYYNGKTLDCLEKIHEVVPQMCSLNRVIIVNFISEQHAEDIDSRFRGNDKFVSYDRLLATYTAKTPDFLRVEFNHPLVIMFSSGTTGKPKCIVHGHGGTLLQHLKEHILHCDIHPGDPVFYFTTCGWMMWNWLISGLACGATLLLFDGSPFYPDGNVLWDYTSRHKCTLFGTSAKYIDALKHAELAPGKSHDLSHLKTLTSTGSPLVHESFDYVYGAIKEDLHLASIYGGTDIISASFGIGNPVSPVYRGELQGPALATPVDVFDEHGRSIPDGGGAGELVCTKPIPSMPVMFWDDPGKARYRGAYYEMFDNIWQHGDWAEKTIHHGLIIHGRSDATLNPGGVRIGTAEIYRQVEQIKAVQESIAVGQDWDGDVRVILFVVLKKGEVLSEDLQKEIKTRIRTGASPRHVPAKIIQVSDIPRTKSGKITELAVRDTIMGRPVKNKTALANPEALDLYADLDALQS